MLAGALMPAAARADGDPASDVLASQSLFLAADANVPAAQQGQIATLLQEARRAGYPLRVAIIASSADLGSVTALWRQPEGYARFLAQELALAYRGPLLVVMPNGYGTAMVGGAPPMGAAALGARDRQLGARGPQLGAATLTAIQRLAAAAGHSLALPAGAAPPASSGATSGSAWVAFALGCVVLALAWGASLRARPPLRRARGAGARG